MSESDRKPRDEEARLLDVLRTLGQQQADIDVVPRALDGLARERGGTDASSPFRARIRVWIALAGAGAAAVGILTIVGGHRARAPSVAAPPAQAEKRAVAPYAVVTGSASLFVDGPGPVRPLLSGDPVPFGVSLRTAAGGGGTLRLAHRADVHLDPGARISVAPDDGQADGILLEQGRISVEVQPAQRPVRVRIDRVAAQITSNAGKFGVLAAGDGRWAAAIDAGEVRVNGAVEPLLVGSQRLVGGGPGLEIAVRPIPSGLALEARAVRTGGESIVEGLSDLLARVEARGEALALDGNGRFRVTPAAHERTLHVAAIDATGRRVEKVVELSARRPRAPSKSLPPSNPPAGETDEDLRIGPANW